jgi:restriction endonuclease
MSIRPQNIKVLSLFLIDSVEKYRRYDAGGHTQKGPYAIMFEEYKRLAAQPDYSTLFHEVNLSAEASDVHEGYFSIDRLCRSSSIRGITTASWSPAIRKGRLSICSAHTMMS